MAQQGRVAIVTGAASGIGLAVAQRLVARGDRIVATDIDEDALARHARDHAWPESRCRLRGLDVRDADAWSAAVDEAVEAFGRLDVVFNIAGFLQPGYVHELDPDDIDRHLLINVRGVMLGTRFAASKMIAQGRGHIVNVSSMSAYAPVPGISVYGASKYAVRAFSIAAAMELKPRGVAVSVVCPDAVATAMLDKQKSYREAAMTFTAPRVLSADEVADELVGRVLDKKPIEVALPRRRKWLARVIDLVPELGPTVAPLFEKQGLSKQRRARGGD